MMKTSRGIRNNNPLNIRRGIKWKGLDAIQDDPVFCQFRTATMGFRAAFICMRTYYNKHNCRTITDIIHRWAPPSENATNNYVGWVCVQTGLQPNEKLPPVSSSNSIWIKIALAMAFVENGKLPDGYDKYARRGFYRATI